jgi:uncharacterized protein YndB with AHSA1/START domain
MKRYSAEIEVKAAPEAVWRVLADVAGWPAWDPTTDGAEGMVEKDGQLTFRSSQAPGQALKVTITAADEPYLLEWTGGVPMAFKTQRTHRVTPHGNGEASLVEVTEELSGPMLPMIERQLPDVDRLLNDFLGALKKRVEAGRSKV